jgi:antitoxin component YwqK of YwqJK toxin-antitoxin module
MARILKKEINELGDYCEYYVNGKGNKDGEYKVFYENKNIASIHEFKNGKYHGKYQSWYENGTERDKCVHKNGKIDGKYQSWYEDGNKQEECNYKNGKLDGSGKNWHDNGEKKVENNYKNGKEEGLCKAWNDKGFLRTCYYYRKKKRLNIKYCIKGWKVLTKLINNKKERRMKRKMILIKNKISQINDCLIYSLIMEYVSWNEKLKIIKKIKQ